MSWKNSFSSLWRRSWRGGVIAAAILSVGLINVNAQAINEGFKDLETLLTQDWFRTNQSEPINSAHPGWFQCPEGGTQINPAHMGPENSCVASNFAAGTGTATISNWLVAPNRTFNNGDTISFWTREIIDNPYPNRMQVRLSTSGTSTNTGGTSSTAVGDFTVLLLDINPDYKVGGYPFEWTEFRITISGLAGPTSGRFAFRFFCEDGGPSGNNSYIIGIDTLTYSPAGPPAPPQNYIDYNGDGRTDLSVTRDEVPGDGVGSGRLTWYNQYISAGGATTEVQHQWGLAGDTVVPLDYDGDNRSDIAVWQALPTAPAYFYIFQSQTGTLRQEQFGLVGDDATVTADYTGDGRADPAIYRASTGEWWYLASDGPLAGQQVVTRWGQVNDRPAPGDYNGDAKADFAIVRVDEASPSQTRFWIRNGTGGGDPGGDGTTTQFGIPGDAIVPGDYDGDSRTDIAVARNIGADIVWFVRPSGGGADIVRAWGGGIDVLVPGDYDGDGRTDFAIWRENPDPAQNYFFILGANGSPLQYEWGAAGDHPVAHFNVH